MSAYAQLPPRLAETAEAPAVDKYGNRERLDAILATLNGRDLGEIADIGGNAGYFCLSLVDAGAARRATVYDLSRDAIATGRELARRMDLDQRVRFVEQAADLAFLESLQPVDTLICLNFLHHAGASYDQDLVQRIGWADYARRWLAAMRAKARIGIAGISFEPAKPVNWDVAPANRAAAFADLIEEAGWSILYGANVADLRSGGIEAANGRYREVPLPVEPPPSPRRRLAKKAARLTGLKSLRALAGKSPVDRLRRYHLFILE